MSTSRGISMPFLAQHLPQLDFRLARKSRAKGLGIYDSSP